MSLCALHKSVMQVKMFLNHFYFAGMNTSTFSRLEMIKTTRKLTSVEELSWHHFPPNKTANTVTGEQTAEVVLQNTVSRFR